MDLSLKASRTWWWTLLRKLNIVGVQCDILRFLDYFWMFFQWLISWLCIQGYWSYGRHTYFYSVLTHLSDFLYVLFIHMNHLFLLVESKAQVAINPEDKEYDAHVANAKLECQLNLQLDESGKKQHVFFPIHTCKLNRNLINLFFRYRFHFQWLWTRWCCRWQGFGNWWISYICTEQVITLNFIDLIDDRHLFLHFFIIHICNILGVSRERSYCRRRWTIRNCSCLPKWRARLKSSN